MDFLYEWTRNLAFYMIIITVILQIIPGDTYKKYVRFFVGLVLILLLTQPIIKLFGMQKDFKIFYSEAKRQQEKLEKEWDFD